MSDDWEHMKLCAARYIAPFHRELTPRSARASTPPADRITWRVWWERKFNDDYAKFVKDNFDKFKPGASNERSDAIPASARNESRHQESDEKEGQ
jgi:hypothetical protein